MQRAQAARANTDRLLPTIHQQLDLLDVGSPRAVSVPLGVADVASELRTFAAHFALGHRDYPFPHGGLVDIAKFALNTLAMIP